MGQANSDHRHAHLWWRSQQFRTLVGVVVLIVLNKALGLGLGGSDDVASAGVAAAFIVMDIQRDIQHRPHKP
jgi:hypothetical protein